MAYSYDNAEIMSLTSERREYVRLWAAKKRNNDPSFRKRHSDAKKVYKNTINGRAKTLWHGARSRAKSKDTECTIDRDWVHQKLSEGVCEATGIPFVLTDGRHPFAPSLDQINPQGGYTKENTQVVICIYNYAKANFAHEDVMTMAINLCSKMIP